MKKILLFFFILTFSAEANAQVFSLAKNLLKKTGLFFSDEEEGYKNTATVVAPYNPQPLPRQVDFSPRMPPVGSQMPQNSCVAWALGYGCRSYYVARQSNTKFVTEQKTLDYSGIVSPSFIYNLLNDGLNKGTSLFRALKLLKDTGACSYESMPYQKYNWHKQPDSSQINEARDFRIETFRRVDMKYAVNNLKAQLANGTPVVVATIFDKKYYNFGYRVKTPFYLWSEFKSEKDGMGHAILLVGYDDSLQAFKFMNSWGTDWGNKGFGWITYKLAPLVMREAYVIKPKNPPPAPTNSMIARKRVLNPEEEEARKRSELNAATILQRTENTVTDEEFHKKGLGVYGLSVIFQRGKPTSEFPDGETEITMLGALNIPPHLGSTFQVVVQFYRSHYGDKGAPVFSLCDEYKLANDFAATTSGLAGIPEGEEVKTDWSAAIPLSALNIPKGMETGEGYLPTKVMLVAEPVLFVDGFAICTGKPVEFEVRH